MGSRLSLFSWWCCLTLSSGVYALPDASVSSELSIGSSVLPDLAGAFGRIGVAFDGTQFLVAWTDSRRGELDIYGITILPDGTPAGADFAIAYATGDQAMPDVAFSGSNFLVVWEGLGSAAQWDIHGAQVTRRNPLLSIRRFVVASHPTVTRFVPTIACISQDNCFVAWSERLVTTPPWSIKGVAINDEGSVLSQSVMDIDSGPLGEYMPVLAPLSAGFFAVWVEGAVPPRTYLGTYLTTDGGLTAGRISYADRVESSMEGSRPSITPIGNSAWIAWSDDVTETRSTIRGVRVGPGGTLQLAQRLSATTDSARTPTVAFDGTALWVAYEHTDATGTQVRALRWHIDGGAGDSVPFEFGGAKSGNHYPKLASDGRGHTLLAYGAYDSRDAGVLRFRILSTGAVDAGASVDGGVSDDAPAPRVYKVTCGCSSAASLTQWVAVAIVLVGLAGIKKNARFRRNRI